MSEQNLFEKEIMIEVKWAVEEVQGVVSESGT